MGCHIPEGLRGACVSFTGRTRAFCRLRLQGGLGMGRNAEVHARPREPMRGMFGAEWDTHAGTCSLTCATYMVPPSAAGMEGQKVLV